jgi:hypothetical protein
METKRFAVGTAVGALTILISGYLLFAARLLGDFCEYALNAGAAAGVPRESPLLWAVVVGALSYGALVTLAVGSQNRHVTIGDGMRLGAVVGLLLWFTADFMLFAISNVGNLASTIVDPFVEAVPGALAGGAVAAVIGRSGIVRVAQAPRVISHDAPRLT